MAFKLWLLALMIFLIVGFSGVVSGANPSIGDAAYDIGTIIAKEKSPYFKAIVPTGLVKAAAKNPNADFRKWYDPVYDDLGWGFAADSATFRGQIRGTPYAYVFDLVGGVVTIAKYHNDDIIYWEDKLGVTDFWLSVLPHEPLDFSSSGSTTTSKSTKPATTSKSSISEPTSSTIITSNSITLTAASKSTKPTSTNQPVSTKFSIGAKVEVTDALNVRDAPGLYTGTVISTKSSGSKATVLSGPYYLDGFAWWEVQYADGTKGYSQDKRLELVPTAQQSVSQPKSPGLSGSQPSVSSAPGYRKNTANVPATTVTRSDIALTKQPTVDSEIASSSESEQLYDVTWPVDPQPSTSTQASQTNSIDDGQSSAKFMIPPGGQITGTDGAGRTFQETADENGYVAIPGSPGDWKLTVSAPGYETLTFNDYAISETEVYGGSGYVNLGLQKIKTENQAPEQAIAYFDVKKGGVVGPVLVPGAMITVQDGSGKIIEQQVDSNGHATIEGTAGLWQYAITAPGYATQTGYLSASGPSSASASANLEVDETGQSSAEQVSFDPLPAQVTEKFKAAPGTLITGTDGSGKKIEATADENGYAFITAAPGNWQWTTSAPGYLTSGPSNYLLTVDSRMDLPQTKDPNSQPASASMTPIDEQPTTQPVDPQSALTEDENSRETAQIAQESIQPEEGSPSQEEEPDMQPANRQFSLELGENIQEIPQFNFEPAQIDSLGEGLFPVMVPGKELLNLPSIPVADENIQETSQADSESDWLGSTDTETGPINSVSTENFVPSALPYNNSTNGANQTLANQAIQQSASAQPASQTQEEMLSQEQKDDISIDDFESQTQGEDPAGEEANNLTS